jgi:hypothetical protein
MKRKPQFLLVEAMEELARNGWCVVLKRLPPQLGWILQGSRSEYDAPEADRTVGKGMWYAEATYLGDDTYRVSQMSMQASPYQAMKNVRKFCREADAKAEAREALAAARDAKGMK